MGDGNLHDRLSDLNLGPLLRQSFKAFWYWWDVMLRYGDGLLDEWEEKRGGEIGDGRLGMGDWEWEIGNGRLGWRG